jgi:TolB-like protein/DNA-binding winged helix-turn-helix (wHTH) protein/Flp pilus assembly protein TadD
VEASSLSKRVVRVGDFALDTQSAELSHDGKKIRLPEQPFQILRLLVARRDELITREELRQQLWPADTFVDFDRGLNSAMKKLRDALGDSAENPTYIETLPRRGYRLIAPVAEATAPAAEPRRIQPWMWVIAAVVVVAAIATVVALRFRAATPIRSIAVLPLANLSGDPKEEYFADGMTEALITDLAQLKEVRVISRTSVMRFKQTKLSLPEIAKQLDVDGVIEGGVVHSGDRVRVTVQLIGAKTDQHIWAHAYEGDMKDVVTLQRDLSSSISSAIHAELTPQRAVQPVNPEAYELFLRGRVAFGKESAGGIKEAITFFQKAVAIQPDFAPGYAALANALSEQAYTGSVGARDSFVPAKQAALKALALDPQLAEAHAALGRILYRYEWNWAGSEQEYRRALSLNPNDAQTHIAYANLLRLLHRDADANAEMERTHAIHPLFAGTAESALGKGLRYRKARDYPKAIAEISKAVQLDPTVPRLHFQLGMTLVEAGRANDGIAEIERSVQLSPTNARFRAWLAWAYATTGDQARARAILAELEKKSAHTFVSPAAMAVVYIGLHENAQALDLLDRAYRERDFELINLIGGNTFQPLKSEPRFRELIRKMRLPEA